MKEKSDHIDHLIARYIAGEASSAETLELEQWMEQSEINRKYFEGICFANQQAVASHIIEKVDVDKAWQKLHHQMKSGRNVPVAPATKRTRILPLWIRVAAVVILVSGLSIFFYNQKNNPQVKYETVAAATSDNILNYTLTDSSVITLNQHSKIACATNYGHKERRVKLTGEAFFSVKHNPEKPFIVESSGTFIKVTGTSFNIKSNDPDSLVEVYVKTGSVLFFAEGKEGISLIAGETGVFNKNNGTFTKNREPSPNITAYANRVFVFYNTTLNEVFRQLNRVYGVTISPECAQLGLCTITVSFNGDNIETILNVIAETLGLKYMPNGPTQYTFKGNICNAEEK